MTRPPLPRTRHQGRLDQKLKEQKDEVESKPAHTPEQHDRAACSAGKGPRADRPGVDGRTNDKRNSRMAHQDTRHDLQSYEH